MSRNLPPLNTPTKPDEGHEDWTYDHRLYVYMGYTGEKEAKDVEPKPEPYYPHDCDNCTFLGPYTENEGTDQAIPYDLYYCATALELYVARYGDNGPDYLSGPPRLHPALAEAQKRAKAKGLVP